MATKPDVAQPPMPWQGWLGTSPWLLLVAILMGGLVAFGEATVLAVGAALIASAFIVRDFRVGVFALILLFPLSESPLMPRAIAGITGLNPLNLLLLATLAALLLSDLPRGAWRRLMPAPLVWLFVVPIVWGGLNGMGHVGEILPSFEIHGIHFDSAGGYLRDLVMKPMFLVLFALLVGAAAARSRRIEFFLVPMTIAAVLAALLGLSYFLQSGGTNLDSLVAEDARNIPTLLGMFSNHMGALFVIVYALMLFTFAETPDRRLRIWLLAAMAPVVAALILSFSRSAFAGFALTTAWFIMTRRDPKLLVLVMVAMAGFLALLPDAIFDRLAYGVGDGANEVSGGRIDGLWLPLLPELWKNPLFGNGHGYIMWSEPMRLGRMLVVNTPHSAYLQALLDMGVVGTLLLLAFHVHVWRKLRRLARDMTIDPTARGFFNGAAVALPLYLLAGFTNFTLTPATEQVFLWLAIGMAYGYGQPDRGDRP